MKQPAGELLAEAALKYMREQIEFNGGMECSFNGFMEPDGKIGSVLLVCSGNRRMTISVLLDAAVCVLIHNHPSGDISPSSADIAQAVDLANQGIGSWVVDNECTFVHQITRVGATGSTDYFWSV